LFRLSKLGIKFIIIFALIISTKAAQAQTKIVHAVLFFSPSCNHCHYVIDEVLPPLAQQYGDQLEIIGIDVTTEAGTALYQSATIYFQVPEERLGIPTLIVGDQLLWGRNEISEQIGAIVESGLQTGGVDWPDIPGLQSVLTAVGYNASNNISSDALTAPMQLTWKDNFLKDPVGNSLAVVVLFSMILSAVGVMFCYFTDSQCKHLKLPYWSTPLLIGIGIIAASYLSYIEITKSDAVCGPIGDCGSVQESPYAYLFGLIPIGIFGLSGYAIMMLAWLMQTYGPNQLRTQAKIGLWGMAWFGLIFSIYLTFLEPFVIGATCAWCLTSAVVITIILWSSTRPALEVMSKQLRDSENQLNISHAETPDWEGQESGPEDINL
jgi:uncharacterized membrane protein